MEITGWWNWGHRIQFTASTRPRMLGWGLVPEVSSGAGASDSNTPPHSYLVSVDPQTPSSQVCSTTVTTCTRYVSLKGPWGAFVFGPCRGHWGASVLAASLILVGLLLCHTHERLQPYQPVFPAAYLWLKLSVGCPLSPSHCPLLQSNILLSSKVPNPHVCTQTDSQAPACKFSPARLRGSRDSTLHVNRIRLSPAENPPGELSAPNPSQLGEDG